MSTVKTPPEPVSEPLPSAEELLERNRVLDSRCLRMDERIVLLEQQNEWLKEQLGLRKSKAFAPSSEATREAHPELCFNEAEALSSPEVPEPTTLTITYRRAKTKGKRADDLSRLPVEEIRHELPESEQVCPQCNGHLHEMGCDTRDEVEMVPATVKVKRHLKIKYACRHCDHNGTGSPVITAEAPAPAFPGSLATPSFVAWIAGQKFELGLPYYRIEYYLDGRGIVLSRQTMANWVMRGAGMLEPLLERMKVLLLKREVLHADETTLQVLHEDGRDATTKSYMWLYRGGRDGPPLILFDYQTTRTAQRPREYLAGFEGFLHVDGCNVYEKLPGVTLVGCWAHARRKFDEVLRTLPKGPRTPLGTIAQEGLNFCNRLFKIDSELRDCTPEQRHAARLERSVPLLRDFEAWLAVQGPIVLPQSGLGRAVAYCRNQWPKLQNFLRDGRLELDNNRAERSIKPFVIGRKNWLFSNTPKGARSSALMYSLVETAKENGLIPTAYLQYLFERMPTIDTSDDSQLDALLPWMPEVHAACKLSG